MDYLLVQAAIRSITITYISLPTCTNDILGVFNISACRYIFPRAFPFSFNRNLKFPGRQNTQFDDCFREKVSYEQTGKIQIILLGDFPARII